jgi:hypothetical protein
MQSINLEYIEQIAIKGLIENMLQASPKKLSESDLLIYQALQSSLTKVNEAINKEEIPF